jgi:hypothetical protein
VRGFRVEPWTLILEACQLLRLKREEERIRRELEEKELEEARALVEQSKKKGKKLRVRALAPTGGPCPMAGLSRWTQGF